MLISLLFAVVVAVVVVALLWGRRYLQGIAAEWSEAASELGLDSTPRRLGRPRISGTIDEMSVDVDVHVRRSGDSSRTVTRYRVRFETPGFDFRLTRQTGLSRITSFFGAQDVATGDIAFDDQFVVKTSDEDRLRAVLDAGTRGMLVRTAAAYPGVVFEDDGVFFERQRLETSREVIVSAVRRFLDVARALSRRRSSGWSAQVVAARERGDLAEVAADLSKSEQKPETLDEQLLELDTLATAGHRADARRRLGSLQEQVPADPEVVGWKRRLESDEPRSSRTGDGTTGPDAAGFADAVFAGNALSFESKRIFDERYRGAVVSWPARVKSVDPVSHGPGSGREGGVRLVATVATIDHDLYGNTDIDAVVDLPAGAGAELRRGDGTTITGELVRIDPLVRNVLISDGSSG